MAQAGKIKSLSGDVTVRSTDGIVRQLAVGDIVFDNEVVETGIGASVVLTLADNREITLGEGQSLLLDETVTASVDSFDSVISDVEALQAALEAGELLEGLEEETAAGEEAAFHFSEQFYGGDNGAGQVGTYLLDPTEDGAVPEFDNFAAGETDSGNSDPVAVNDELVIDEDTQGIINVLANDSDRDGDTITVDTFTQPANGTVVYNNDGTFTYIPNENYNGSDSFTYTITDGKGGTDTATVNIVVNPVNDVPEVSADTGAVVEDVITSVSGQLSIDDPDESESVFQANTIEGEYGTFTVETDGAWTYSLTNDDERVQALAEGEALPNEVFTVLTADGTETTVTVSITGTNDQPTVEGVELGVVEGGDLVTGSVSATDTDTNDTHTYALVENAPAGFILNPDGTYSFDPSDPAYDYLAQGQELVITIPYVAIDDSGTSTDTSDPANIVITITGTNDAPEVSVGTGAVVEDVTLTTSGVLTVEDPDEGESVFQANTIEGEYGTFTVETDGTWTYELNNDDDRVQALAEGESLPDEVFTVLTADGAPTTVTVSITGTNDQPTVEGVEFGAVEGGDLVTGSLTVEDTDTVDTHIFELVEDAPAGFILNPDGTYSFDPSDPAYDYLAQGQELVITIPYVATDDSGTSTDTSEPANIVITITGTNDAPEVSVGTGAVIEDVTLTTGGKLDVTDLDEGESVFQANTIEGAYGTFTVETDGTWTYELNNDDERVQALAEGESLPEEVFTVLTADGTETTVTVSITGTNDQPAVEGVELGAVEGGELVTGSVSATDTDTNDTHTYALVENAPTGFILNPDGTYSFDPSDPAYDYLAEGQELVITIPYVATDDSGTSTDTSEPANIVITITGTNDVPEVSVGEGAVKEDVTLATSGKLDVTDLDEGESVFQANTIEGEYGTFTVGTDGTWTYELNNDDDRVQALAEGESLPNEVFTVLTADGTETTVTVSITGTNDQPTVEGVEFGAVEGGDLVTGSVSATDTDTNDTHTYALVEDAPAGFVLNPDGTYSFDPSDPAYDYLAQGQELVITIPYVAIDDSGTSTDTSDPANIVITITGTNDAPEVSVGTGAVVEDTQITTGGTLTVNDPDEGESYFQPQTDTAGTYGTFVIDAEGNWTYELDNDNPAVQALGEGETLPDEVFTVLTADGTPTTVTVSITGTNDAPIATDNTNSITEVNPAKVNLVIALDVSGSMYHDSYGDIKGPETRLQIARDSLKALLEKYDPEDIGGVMVVEFFGDVSTVEGGQGVWMTYEEALAYVSRTDIPGTVQFDTDFDSTLDEIMDNYSSTKADGTLPPADKTLVYFLSDGDPHGTDNGNHNRIDANEAAVWQDFVGENFSDVYAIGVGSGIKDLAKAQLKLIASSPENVLIVTDENDLTHTLVSTAPNTVSGNVITDDDGYGVDSDVDNDISELLVTGIVSVNVDTNEPSENTDGFVIEGQYGTLVIKSDGSYVYTLNNNHPDVNGLTDCSEPLSEVFVYTVSDGIDTDTANLTITINGINDAPVITGVDSGAVIEDTQTEVSGKLNVNDPDEGESTFQPQTDVAGTYGTFTIDADGNWTYTLNNDDPRVQALGEGESLESEVFTVLTADGTPTTVTVSITGTNDQPAVEDVSLTATEGGALVTGSVIATDTDTTDEHTYALVDEAPAGFVLNPDGTYSFDPSDPAYKSLTEGQTLVLEIPYVAADDSGADNAVSNTGVITITLTGTNDVPEVTTDTGAVKEDVTLTATGKLDVTDIDEGESVFQPQTNVAGEYGTFSIDADGNWTYELNNDLDEVQALGEGETLPAEVFTVLTADGTPTTVTVSITGTNDAPAIDLQADAVESVVSYIKANASFDNIVGAYTLDADGNPEIIINSSKSTSFGEVYRYEGSASDLHFFIIANGKSKYAGEIDVSFDENGKLLINGNAPSVPVYYSESDKNPGGLEHFKITNNGGILTVKIEDLPNLGDKDFDDVVLTVREETLYTGTGYETSYTENDPGVSIVSDTVTITDIDSNSVIKSAVIELTNPFDGDYLSVELGDLPDGITAVVSDDLTTVTLTGEASHDEYQEALKAVKYASTSENPDSADRIVEITVNDGYDNSNTAVTTVQVIPVNDAPVAANDTAVTDENTSVIIDVLENDSDPDGDEISITDYDGTSVNGGTVTLNPNGTFTYTPATGFDGEDTFTYTITDPDGLESTATVTVTVNNVNDAPVANDDGRPNFSFAGLTGNYYAVNTDNNGYPDEVDRGSGYLIDDLGEFKHIVNTTDPAATFEATKIWYGADNTSGGVSTGSNLSKFLGHDSGSLEYANGQTNTAEGGVHISGKIYIEAGTYNFRVRADDGYEIIIGGQSRAKYELNQSPATRTHGNFTIEESGWYDVEMYWWDQGGQYVFQPEISADGGQTYTKFTNEGTFVTPEDQAIDFTALALLGNDTDPDGDELTIIGVDNAQNGTVTLNPDGSVTFTPDADYNGPASFEYTITDGNGGEDTATVYITVSPVNDAPVANDNIVSFTESDEAVGVEAAVTIVKGEVFKDGLDPADFGLGGKEEVTYSPNPHNQNINLGSGGNYAIIDLSNASNAAINGGSGNDYIVIGDIPSNSYVNVNAGNGNDVLVLTGALNNDFNYNGGSGYDILVLSGSESDYTFNTHTNQVGGGYVIEGQIYDKSTGKYIQINQIEEIVFGGNTSVSYTVEVETSVPLGSEDTVVITVTSGSLSAGINNGDGTWTLTASELEGLKAFPEGTSEPKATNAVIYGGNSGGGGSSVVEGNVITDIDSENGVDYDIDNDISDLFIASVDGTEVSGETLIEGNYGRLYINPDGSYRYELTANLSAGEQEEVFEYTLSDGDKTDTANLIIKLTGINNAPVANDDAAVTDENTSVIISVLANDSDPDGDPLTISDYDVTTANGGTVTLNSDGTFTYTPAANFDGTDTFTYTVEDPSGETSNATVTVTVNDTNNPPVAENDGRPNFSFASLEGNYYAVSTEYNGLDGSTYNNNNAYLIDNLAEFKHIVANTDPAATFDATKIWYNYGTGSVSQGENLKKFLGEDGASLEYTNGKTNTAEGGFHISGSVYIEAGSYKVDVRADDGYEILLNGKRVAVYENNQSPTSRTHYFVIAVAGYHSIDLFWWDQGGEYVFEPKITNTVTNEVFYLSNEGVYTAEQNSPAIFTADDLLVNDSDPDGDAISITGADNARNGSVDFDEDGNIVFTPNDGFSGSASFDYTITDAKGGTDTARVYITVKGEDASLAAMDFAEDNDINLDTVTEFVDAGEGYDTLIIDSGEVLDFSLISNLVTNIDKIDLTEGDNTLSNLKLEDVLSVIGESDTLVIKGNNGDVVTIDNADDSFSAVDNKIIAESVTIEFEGTYVIESHDKSFKVIFDDTDI